MTEIMDFAPRCLCLDLEVDPSDKRILKIGALRPDTNTFLHFQGKFDLARALDDLDRLAMGASFVLGHNVIRHDLNLLKAQAPGLKLLELPVVDTLALSPLAFPRNPYHHLVKDYRLLKMAVNDPLADARLTVELFRDQRDALQNESSDVLGAYHFLLAQDGANSGLNNFFMTLTKAARPGREETVVGLHKLLDNRVCRQRLERLLNVDLDDPAQRPAIAYVLAWLQVAGQNSSHATLGPIEYPMIVPLVRELRATPCRDPSCSWCRESHDTRRWLKRWFGYDDFRRDESGHSLQNDIVSAEIAGHSLLGILQLEEGSPCATSCLR